MANFAGFVPTSGYVPLLAALTSGLSCFARLYVNDPDFTAGLTAADFVEISYAGYVPARLAKWTPPALAGGVAYSTADPVIFQYTGGPLPAPAQGVWVTDANTGALLWAWRRPGGAWQMSDSLPVVTAIVTLTLPGFASYLQVGRGGRAEGGRTGV